ncbi:MAG: TolC family protein [Gemmatimonadota bacterium]|nr:MAG: TolC family protein [Gemmatimonadota bacterium]
MIIAIILLMAAQPAVPATQPDTVRLSLHAAIERAHEHNPSLRAERAEADAAAGRAQEATPAYLPSIGVDMGFLRTNDPVAVFGLKLRQSNFQAQDLALDALNSPDPYNGFNTVATIELPIFTAEGIFGHSAAKRAASAREAAASRAAGATTFFVTRAYWDAQLSARQVEALAAALEAALSHARQAEAMQQQGLVTSLDARLARVHAAGTETQLLAARARADNALSALRTMLALPDSTPITLTDSLVGDGSSACEGADAVCTIDDRGDVVAHRMGNSAAAAAVRSAWGKNLPAVAAFGSYGYFGQSNFFGAGGGGWTIGIGLQWKLFPGLAGIGAINRAKAERRAADARLAAAEDEARLEVTRTQRMLAAATERVSVAASADSEAQQALEQARLRYQTGASTITELLDVQAAATAATLSLLSARRDLFLALAALDFAYGVNDR